MKDTFDKITCDKVIVTNRHPLLKNRLEREFGCPVYCRDYCLTIEDMFLQIMNPNNSFYQEMSRYKIDTVNELSREYDHVIFFDDMMQIYDTEYLLPNIHIRLPYHIVEHGQSEIDGLIYTLLRCNSEC